MYVEYTEELKRAIKAYEEKIGEEPPMCIVGEPDYSMEYVRRGKPSEYEDDPLIEY